MVLLHPASKNTQKNHLTSRVTKTSGVIALTVASLISGCGHDSTPQDPVKDTPAQNTPPAIPPITGSPAPNVSTNPSSSSPITSPENTEGTISSTGTSPSSTVTETTHPGSGESSGESEPKDVSTTPETDERPIVPSHTMIAEVTKPLAPATVLTQYVPQSAIGGVELGPISGASIQFQTIDGRGLSGTLTTASDGSLVYNPSDILSRMGTASYLIAKVTGGLDLDADDDGVYDSTPTPVLGIFSQVISRSALQNGEKIYINPRAGIVSETLLSRKNPIISDVILDTLARETGAEDTNDNGKVEYRDIYSIAMKNVTDVSGVIPAVSGYIASVHSGDTTRKQTALRNIAKFENHLVLDITPNTLDTSSIDPVLQIQSISPDATIYYTLDGSSPRPGGATTFSAVGTANIPLQSNRVAYREEYELGGIKILGKVATFDLLYDWIELSQSRETYNASGAASEKSEAFTYKEVPWKLTTQSNRASSGYTYPKLIDCQVGLKATTGCQLGPYFAYSADHESRIRSLITASVQAYIDTGAENLIAESPNETITNGRMYGNSSYRMYLTWTIDPVTKKRVYPATISGMYDTANGWTNIAPMVIRSALEKDSTIQSFENMIKLAIDENTVGHTQNEETSLTGKIENYFGGWYEVIAKWNATGDQDYPVTVTGTYADAHGRQPNIVTTASGSSDLSTKLQEIVKKIQDAIRYVWDHLTPPTYAQNTVLDSGFIPYKGYGYHIITTMNTTGASDFPATVTATYTAPSGSHTTTIFTVQNESEMQRVQTERANEVKARIDYQIGQDQYSPGAIEVVTPDTSYNGGKYRTEIQYSTNTGDDYPAYIDIYHTFRDGTTDKWTMQVDNENVKNLFVQNGEAYVRSQIDNYHPTYAPLYLGTDGPYPYAGGSYTIYARYNNNHESKNYPAKVWIEYKKSGSSTLYNTWDTYGNTIATTYAEKEQMKSTLIAWVKSQITTPISSSALARSMSITSVSTDTLARSEMVMTSAPMMRTTSLVILPTPVDIGARFGNQVPSFQNPSQLVQGFVVPTKSAGNVSGVTQPNGKKPNVSAANEEEIQEKMDDRVNDIISRYATDGTLYLGDLPENAVQVLTAVFADIINKKTSDVIISKYRSDLLKIGMSKHGIGQLGQMITFTLDGSPGEGGAIGWSTSDAVETVVVIYTGARVPGSLGIYSIVSQTTGKIWLRTVTGLGAADFLRYEAQLVAKGGIKMLDSQGNTIKLMRGTSEWGFEHIWTFVRSNGLTRVQEIMQSTRKSWLDAAEKELGFSFNNPYAFQKLIENILKNGQRIEQTGVNSGKWLYEATIGGRKWGVTVEKGTNTITTLLNPY